ncbi:hypothetical protein BCF59_0615 [Mycoplasmopsis mustelae]|uniref:Uncharacterized protein n=1 Tax=Mycoplasmopsis mustelae TaxID=171289 RepID=A0A4V3FNV2_9BACT|nr:hypothetical protein [Mycoplasmopsis mustelae]TDV23269.1 hypothetical protein BCF59_0615 [Mycoplasmopsis mustelae]
MLEFLKILIVLLSLIIFVFVLFFCFVLFGFYKRSSSGIILFKVDYINKRVIRLNSKFAYLSTIFDAKHTDFEMYNYMSVNDFLDYFNQQTKDKILAILDNSEVNEYKLDAYLCDDKEMVTLLKKFSLIDRIIYKFDTKLKKNKKYYLEILSNSKGDFYGKIHWNHFDNINVSDKLENLHFKENFRIKSGNYLVLGFALNSYYLTDEIRYDDIKELAVTFNLNPEKEMYFYKDGIIYFLAKKNTHKKIEIWLNEAKKINKNTWNSKLLLATSVFETKMNSVHDIIEIERILKYSLFNIINNPNESQKYLGNELFNKPEELRKFKEDLNLFEYIHNSKQKVNIKHNKILNFQNDLPTRLSVAKIIEDYPKNSIKNFELFEKIPYLKLKVEKNNYQILQNQNIANSKNTILKISQETFLQKEFNSADNLPIPLVYSEINFFNSNKTQTKIQKNLQNKIPTTLYINQIDKSLITILNDMRLKVIVIGKNIASKIHQDNNLFLDCVSVVNIAKKKAIRIIYEDIEKNLDPLIIQKAEVKFYYKSN